MSPAKHLYLAGVIVLAVLAVLIYFTWSEDLVRNKDIPLSEEQREVFENQIGTAQQKLFGGGKALSDNEQALHYFNIARGQFGLGRYDDSRGSYERVIKLQPNNPTAHYDYFNVLLAMQDYDNARKAVQKGVEIFPRSADLWRGYIALEKSHFGINDTELISIYIQAMERSFHHPDIVVPFAHHLEGKGNLMEALKYWRALAGQYPDVNLYKEQVRRLEAELR